MTSALGKAIQLLRASHLTAAPPTATAFRSLTARPEWLPMQSVSTFGHVVPYEAYLSFQQQPKTFPIQNFVFPLSDLQQPSTTPRFLQPVISTCTLLDSPQYSLCIFCLPPQAQLDLHNHPTMAVWQSVLCGSVQVLHMDFADSKWNTAAEAPKEAEAIVCGNEVVPAGSTPSLFDAAAGGGVLHLIRNPSPSQWAVFVDLISLPYGAKDPTSQRTLDCSYYDVVRVGGAEGGSNRTLEVPSSRTAALLRDTMLLKEACVGTRLLLQRADAYQGPEMRALLSVKA